MPEVPRTLKAFTSIPLGSDQVSWIFTNSYRVATLIIAFIWSFLLMLLFLFHNPPSIIAAVGLNGLAIGIVVHIFHEVAKKNTNIVYSELKEKVRQKTVELIEKVSLAEEVKVKDDTILTNIGEGVILTDQNGKIIIINQQAKDRLNLDTQIGIDDRLENVLIEEGKGYFLPFEQIVVKWATSTVNRKPATIHFIPLDKNAYPIEGKIAPMIIKGKLVGTVVILPDILIEKMKAEFLSVAAHQLRAPLGSMRWGLEMLLAKDVGEMPKPIEELLKQIYSSNKWMITLVNDLLNVSRIDLHRIQDEPELMDVAVIINAVVAELKLDANKRSISVEVIDQRQKTDKILLDAKRFREVAQNLISNAIKYSHDGGEVKVTIGQTDALVTIIIADEGIGIPKADQEMIFSKFYRAKNAALSQTEGTGLGLFVVKSYVEEWGGKVSFQSAEGKGSTFIVELPINKSIKKSGPNPNIN